MIVPWRANPNTVVVLVAGDPIAMTGWIDFRRRVLYVWYGGQEAGHAVAARSLRRRRSVPQVAALRRRSKTPPPRHYPGADLKVEYSEGVFVGYRYYDTKNVEPQFPFGFGLSYTTFEYSDLKMTGYKTAGRLRSGTSRSRCATRAAGRELK